MNKKYFLSIITLTFLLIGCSTLFHATNVDAHGYVQSPISRSYQGLLDKESLGWSSAYSKYGNAIREPQSLEAPKGFPEKGPTDGRLASANGVLGDDILDQPGANRWKKQSIKTGPNDFTWFYTASHSTAKWHYYMTKPGWNPEKKLNRDSLELIGEVSHNGAQASTNKTHTISIPGNRSGYHVIYAVWDVADTSNAFYQVIDVDVNGNGESSDSSSTTDNSNSSDSSSTADNSNSSDSSCTTDNGSNPDVSLDNTNNKPSVPTELHSMKTTANSVDLMWSNSNHSSGIAHYEIYRNGKKVNTSTNTSFEDTDLEPNTSYTYKVKAISVDGTSSDFSNEFNVMTRNGTNLEDESGYEKPDTGMIYEENVQESTVNNEMNSIETDFLPQTGEQNKKIYVIIGFILIAVISGVIYWRYNKKDSFTNLKK